MEHLRPRARYEEQRHGKEMLQKLCARCHSVGRTGASPNRLAPPFRSFSETKLYDSDFLQRLQDGLYQHPSLHADLPLQQGRCGGGPQLHEVNSGTTQAEITSQFAAREALTNFPLRVTAMACRACHHAASSIESSFATPKTLCNNICQEWITRSSRSLWRLRSSAQGNQSAVFTPRPNPHSVRCTAAAHLPRFRALALLGRRPPTARGGLVMPASEKSAQQRK